jgi:hypothetical protein
VPVALKLFCTIDCCCDYHFTAMGIPGLARRSEPYAECRSAEQLKGYQAIVDGPSLAYHAHKLALAGSPRVPSYADVNAEAIRWLNSLETANIQV